MGRSGVGEALDLEGPHALMKKMRDSKRGLSSFFPSTPLQKGRDKTGLSLSISSDESGSTVREARRAHTDLGYLFGRNREGGKHANPPGYDRYYTAVWDTARGTAMSWDPSNRAAKKAERVSSEEKATGEKKEAAVECAPMEVIPVEKESPDAEEKAETPGGGELSQRTQDLKKQVEDLRDSVFSSKCRNLLGLARGRASRAGAAGRGTIAEDVEERRADLQESDALETRSESYYGANRKSVLQDLKWDATPSRNAAQGNSHREFHSAPPNFTDSTAASSDVEGENDAASARGPDARGGAHGERDGCVASEKGDANGENPSTAGSRVSEPGFSSNCSFSRAPGRLAAKGKEGEVHGGASASFVSLPSHFYSVGSGITVTGSCEGALSTEGVVSTGDVNGERGALREEHSSGRLRKSSAAGRSVSTVETGRGGTCARTDTDDLSHSYGENEAAFDGNRPSIKVDRSTAMSVNAGGFGCVPEIMVLRDAGNIKGSHNGVDDTGVQAHAPATPKIKCEQEVEKDWLPQLVPQALLQSFGINGLSQGTATKLPDQFHLHLHFPHKDVVSLSSQKGETTRRQAISSTALIPKQSPICSTEIDRSISNYNAAETQCAEETKSAGDDGNSSWAALRVLCKTMDETVQVACQKLSEGEPEQDRSKDESWTLLASQEKYSNSKTPYSVQNDADGRAGGKQDWNGRNLTHVDEQYYTENMVPNENPTCRRGFCNANRHPKWLESWLASQVVDDSFVESDIIGSSENLMENQNRLAFQQGAVHQDETQYLDQTINGYGDQDQFVPSNSDITPAKLSARKSAGMRAMELRQNPNLYKDGFTAGVMQYRNCKDQTQPNGVSGHTDPSAARKNHQTTSDIKLLDIERLQVQNLHVNKQSAYKQYQGKKINSRPRDTSTQGLPVHFKQNDHGRVRATASNNSGSDYSIPASLSASAIEKSIDEADAEWRKRQEELLRKVKEAGASAGERRSLPIK